MIFVNSVTPAFVSLQFVLKVIKEVNVFKLGFYSSSQSELFTFWHISLLSRLLQSQFLMLWFLGKHPIYVGSRLIHMVQLLEL